MPLNKRARTGGQCSLALYQPVLYIELVAVLIGGWQLLFNVLGTLPL